jgi:3-oxoacyl-[acyl-carrier-protein] synthase II
MIRRRVVLTGLGTVNPLANSVPAYWSALLAGRSGIAPITQFDTKDFSVHFGGEVKNFDAAALTGLNAREVKRLDRFSQFALAAAIEAVRDSGVDFSREDRLRCGCILGCGIGGLNSFEEAHNDYHRGGPRRIGPLVIPKMIANAGSGNISIHFGLMGVTTSVATACASAGNAVGDALRAIRHDEADIIISGGTEAAITIMGLGGFCSMRALSTRNDDPPAASRPFDRDRDGFVLSEGAGLVVLEEYEHARRRGANIYCELLGTGSTADAHHITAPHPEGLGAIGAMQLALRDAALSIDQIDYVNAHGTSTDLGDVAETLAIKKTFGDHARRLAVSSTKSMLGHLLGASGGVELIATALTLRHRVIHPTINLRNPDLQCDLDYVPNMAREKNVRYSISNSFGFGGHNVCLAVGAV